jgi:hypothetical protein
MLGFGDGMLRTACAVGWLLVASGPASAHLFCSGDCNGLGGVSGSELLRGIGIALGEDPVTSCPAADLDLSDGVDVSEIIAAANAALGLLCLPPLLDPQPGTVAIDVGIVAGSAGATVSVPVTLDADGLAVAGVQNDITFNSLTPIAATGAGTPDCAVNPDTGKSLYTAFRPAGCTPGATCTGIRALVLSLTDLSPIPDGVLYTCTVTIAPEAPAGTYPLINSTLGSSDPLGTAQPVTGADGAIIVSEPPDPPIDPSTLVLSVARLRAAPADEPHGALLMRALVDDNDSGGALAADAVATGVTVHVQSPPAFDVAWTFPPCRTLGDGRIVCRSADHRRKATFQPSRQGPSIYKLRVTATNLLPTETGAAAPTGPVRIRLGHTARERADDIGNCRPSRATGVRCVER